MNGVRQGRLVALRELRERGRSKAFRISMVIVVLTVAVMIVLPSVLKSSKTKDVGFAGPVPAGLVQAVQSQSRNVGLTARVHHYPSVAAGEHAVRDRKISVLVANGNKLEWPGSTDQQLRAVVTSAVGLVAIQQRAAAAGISPQGLGAVLAPVQVTNVELGAVAGRGPDDENAALFMTGLMLLIIAVFGGMVLASVVEEKSSRVVEVVLARIPARYLLAGKVAGIGLLGLAMVGATAIAAVIAIASVGSFHIPAVRAAVLAWIVVWFLLGYLLYATMYGALGALASRPEDSQTVAAPAMAIMIASYFASFFMIRQPFSPFAKAISFVPFTAPLSMPNRIAMGATAWWEPLVSVGVAVAAIAGLVVVAGRVYERAILRGGPTLGLRDVLQVKTASEPRQAPRGPRNWLGNARAYVNRRTIMAKTEQKVSPRGTAEILAAGVVLGLIVWMLTGDVIIGVIAGGGLAALVGAVANTWIGHGGPHRTP